MKRLSIGAATVLAMTLSHSAMAQSPNYWRASNQLLFQGVSAQNNATDPPPIIYGLSVKMCSKTYHNTSIALLTSDNGCRIMYLSMSDIDGLIVGLQAYKTDPSSHQGDPGYVFARVEDTGTIPLENIPGPVSTHYPQ